MRRNGTTADGQDRIDYNEYDQISVGLCDPNWWSSWFGVEYSIDILEVIVWLIICLNMYAYTFKAKDIASRTGNAI